MLIILMRERNNLLIMIEEKVVTSVLSGSSLGHCQVQLTNRDRFSSVCIENFLNVSKCCFNEITCPGGDFESSVL